MEKIGLPEHVTHSFMLQTEDERVRTMILHLCRSYPHSIRGDVLLGLMGVGAPTFLNIVTFHNKRIQASQILAEHGLAVMRTGGSIGDGYWIEMSSGRAAA